MVSRCLSLLGVLVPQRCRCVWGTGKKTGDLDGQIGHQTLYNMQPLHCADTNRVVFALEQIPNPNLNFCDAFMLSSEKAANPNPKPELPPGRTRRITCFPRPCPREGLANFPESNNFQSPFSDHNHNYCLVCCNHDSDSEYDDAGDGVDDDGDCNDGDCDAAEEDDGGDPAAGDYDDVDNSLVWLAGWQFSLRVVGIITLF